ncbi:MAG: DNA cytosine methyltransferase [Citrobacter freundii]|nr:DNA cytosine methyltransferase [Citrobacter freundii]
MTAAYYNEIDPYAAQWLRNLMAAGLIAPGFVDERSIEDVTPADLRGFTQVHFFAGIGVWSYALRRAGWPDSRPVWTGSCPCQPFSPAGKGKGFTDERHLWPAMHWLVGQCDPVVIFGEQSASADANDWIDLVQADMEAMGYAFGACAFPSASVGAPHIRDRAYWVADTNREQYKECLPGRAESHCAEACWPSVELTRFCLSGGVAYTSGKGSQRGVSGGRMRNGKLSTDTLDVVAQIAGPARLTVSGDLLTGCSARMKSGGQLNPNLSRWLMGLPPEWDAFAPTETPSTLKRQQRS